MAERWVEVKEEDVLPFWKRPDILLPAALVLLLIVIVGAVLLLSQRGGGNGVTSVTIQELNADQDAYDGQSVVVIGEVGDVYRMPVLGQYAIYRFDDGEDTMWVLTDKGVPPEEERVELTATFNAAITLDKQLERLVEDRFGPIVGTVVETIIPEIPLNVVYLRHDKYGVED